MIEQEIERKISDFRDMGLPEYFPRNGSIHCVDNMISTIIGARRTGKSFRMIQEASEQIKQKKIQSINHICWLDFDNPILSGINASELFLIQSTFLKLTPDINLKTPLLFLLDEIHKVKGWEEYVIDLSRNPNWKVIVSGSSSKMLSHDIATELRGKAVSTNLFPLSFAEFLTFKKAEHSLSTRGQAETRRLFDEYLAWGAYPAIAKTDEYLREPVLREYFDTMILKDIIQRYNVSKPRQCIQLCRYLLSNISKPCTLQSGYRYLKQAGYATSKDAIRNYIEWAKDSWLLFSVPILSDSLREQERNYKKTYAIDWALANKNSQVWDGGQSRALENMIFLHLRRNWHRVHYYLTGKKRQEVDFIVIDNRGKPIMAVQVCLNISEKETLQRELESLTATANYFKTEINLIITYNQEKDFSMDGINIKASPAWKWLLEYSG